MNIIMNWNYFGTLLSPLSSERAYLQYELNCDDKNLRIIILLSTFIMKH